MGGGGLKYVQAKLKSFWFEKGSQTICTGRHNYLKYNGYCQVPWNPWFCKIQHQSRMYDVFIITPIACNAKAHDLRRRNRASKTPGICFLLCVELLALEYVHGIRYARLGFSIDHLSRELVSRPG